MVDQASFPGMQNPGSLCYMISTLQQLYYLPACPPPPSLDTAADAADAGSGGGGCAASSPGDGLSFRDAVLSMRLPNDKCGSEGCEGPGYPVGDGRSACLLRYTQRVFEEMRMGRVVGAELVASLAAAVRTPGASLEAIDINEQRDAAEFLVLLLSQLEMEYTAHTSRPLPVAADKGDENGNACIVDSGTNLSLPSSLCGGLMKGIILHDFVSQEFGDAHRRRKSEPFFIAPLPLPRSTHTNGYADGPSPTARGLVSFEHMLDLLFQPADLRMQFDVSACECHRSQRTLNDPNNHHMAANNSGYSHTSSIISGSIPRMSIPVRKTSCLDAASLPRSLLFHVHRFEYDTASRRQRKLLSGTEVPALIDLSKYICADQDASSISGDVVASGSNHCYALRGVVVHSGTCESGHYFSYVHNRTRHSGGGCVDHFKACVDSLPGMEPLIRAHANYDEVALAYNCLYGVIASHFAIARLGGITCHGRSRVTLGTGSYGCSSGICCDVTALRRGLDSACSGLLSGRPISVLDVNSGCSHHSSATTATNAHASASADNPSSPSSVEVCPAWYRLDDAKSTRVPESDIMRHVLPRCIDLCSNSSINGGGNSGGVCEYSEDEGTPMLLLYDRCSVLQLPSALAPVAAQSLRTALLCLVAAHYVPSQDTATTTTTTTTAGWGQGVECALMTRVLLQLFLRCSQMPPAPTTTTLTPTCMTSANATTSAQNAPIFHPEGDASLCALDVQIMLSHPDVLKRLIDLASDLEGKLTLKALFMAHIAASYLSPSAASLRASGVPSALLCAEPIHGDTPMLVLLLAHSLRDVVLATLDDASIIVTNNTTRAVSMPISAALHRVRASVKALIVAVKLLPMSVASSPGYMSSLLGPIARTLCHMAVQVSNSITTSSSNTSSSATSATTAGSPISISAFALLSMSDLSAYMLYRLLRAAASRHTGWDGTTNATDSNTSGYTDTGRGANTLWGLLCDSGATGGSGGCLLSDCLVATRGNGSSNTYKRMMHELFSKHKKTPFELRYCIQSLAPDIWFLPVAIRSKILEYFEKILSFSKNGDAFAFDAEAFQYVCSDDEPELLLVPKAFNLTSTPTDSASSSSSTSTDAPGGYINKAIEGRRIEVLWSGNRAFAGTIIGMDPISAINHPSAPSPAFSASGSADAPSSLGSGVIPMPFPMAAEMVGTEMVGTDRRPRWLFRVRYDDGEERSYDLLGTGGSGACMYSSSSDYSSASDKSSGVVWRFID